TNAGVVTAVANGSAFIIASSGTLADTSTITIAQAVAKVALTPESLALAVDSTAELAAVAQDAKDNPVADATFTWTSRNTAVATVDDSGIVTGVAEGTTRIVATSGGFSDSTSVTVAAVVPQGPTSLAVVSGDEQSGTVAEPLADSLVVRLTDA